jgi:hypothetical protein
MNYNKTIHRVRRQKSHLHLLSISLSRLVLRSSMRR